MLTIRVTALAACAVLAASATPHGAHAAPLCQKGWEVVPSPDPSRKGDDVLKAVSGQAGNDIWAVGQYAPDSNINVLQTLTVHYDGTAWQAVPSPNVGAQANALIGLATAPGGLAWAVGYHIDDHSFFARSLLEAWDGTAWHLAAYPEPGAAAHLFAVSAKAADDVWAVGETEPRIGEPHTLTLHFDGMSWTVVASPNPGNAGNILYGVAALASNDVWAVGAETNIGGPNHALLLHWDGNAWHVAPAPRDGRSNTALYAVGHGLGGFVAVGEAEDDLAGRTIGLAEGGSGFAIEPTDVTKIGDDHLYGFTATPSGDWAVGSSINWNAPGGGAPRTLVERRQGPNGSWQIVASPDPTAGGENQLGGIAYVAGSLWAVGAHDGPNSLRSLIIRRCS